METVLSVLGIRGTGTVGILVLVSEGSKLEAIGTIARGRRRGLGAGIGGGGSFVAPLSFYPGLSA